MENDSLLAFAFILAISVVGAARLLRMNDLLAAFAAGLTFCSHESVCEKLEELPLQESAGDAM